MPPALVRASSCLLATALLLGACGDGHADVGADKLAALTEGSPRDSVLHVFGTGPLTAKYADTLRLEHGFRRERYLIAGRQYEVLYYRELPGTVTEPVQQAKETPVVLQEGKVLGLGWRYYVETAMPALQLPNPTGTLRTAHSGA